MKTVYKPWGKEEWLELNEFYCYKRIYINSGYKTSFQYHNTKIETNYIIAGTAEVWLENDIGVIVKSIMSAGDFFTVMPLKKHRVIAMSDIILQEVSTPQVDDVIRINDEFLRGNGKIEDEQKIPAVLILASGIGSRLGNLTKNINKSLIPINSKAIISYIINKFPKEYDIIISVGYKGELIKEYCQIVHSDRNIIYVDINNFDGPGSGPGVSALRCAEYLQRPFYLTVADCIIDSELPPLDSNWLGVQDTSSPEKYATVKADNGAATHIINKSYDGYEYAFIGLAGIREYSIFWQELNNNIENGELISAFKNLNAYTTMHIKQLNWFDTGNLDSLNKTNEHFNTDVLSLHKETDELIYNDTKIIKYNANPEIIRFKSHRAKILKDLIPANFSATKNFIYYDWEPGKTVYEFDSIEVYDKFLDFYSTIINNSIKNYAAPSLYEEFYVSKTTMRKNMFITRFGAKYYADKFTINYNSHDSLENILSKFDFTALYPDFGRLCYSSFHGDLQFDNIIYNQELEKFTYIDWRDSFANYVEGGDIYYDLAKLYGGCLIPYNMMKKANAIEYFEGSSNISYTYSISNNLKKFRVNYERWIISNGYNLDRVRMLTAIIFLNMAALHDEKFSKLLWFKSIEMLSEYVK